MLSDRGLFIYEPTPGRIPDRIACRIANIYFVLMPIPPSLGFPFAFGVFQQYYATHAPFSDDVTSIAAIGTTASVRETSSFGSCLTGVGWIGSEDLGRPGCLQPQVSLSLLNIAHARHCANDD